MPDVRPIFTLGGVAEWLKAPLSKSGMGAIPSRVRISPPPQKKSPILLRMGLIEHISSSFVLHETQQPAGQGF